MNMPVATFRNLPGDIKVRTAKLRARGGIEQSLGAVMAVEARAAPAAKKEPARQPHTRIGIST
ncbi:MAG: hypothetical protein KGK11_08285 [Sphingomonadales bacterium]|nr:hypothetical protein [Sphingomonadales bacterium]